MKLTYRAEIDGLRAIAVMAVILYHAQISTFGHNFFKGGFIGVDIFFVISGYLIGSLILKELQTTGKFSFSYFYERRARRILPALFVVMLSSLPFAWSYLLPHSFIDFAKSILSSLVFVSNYYFHYTGLQYGTESGLLKPFLHTWSLSIEEQFYVIFPVSLFIFFKYLKKYITHIIILGIVVSLIIADWGIRNHPSFNFYLLPARGWELLAGTLLAKLELQHGRVSHKIFNKILPLLGIFLIGYSVAFYDHEILHPSFHNISPIVGVMLIIWFSKRDELFTKILSSKLFVGMGLISYSLYLWHYPIFAFGRIKDDAHTGYDKIEWIVLTIFLSVLSYFFIEKPFRKKNKIKLPQLIVSLIFSMVILFSFQFHVLNKDGFKDRLPEIINVKDDSKELRRKEMSENCSREKCLFNNNKDQTIVMAGDSHLGVMSWNLKNELAKNNYNLATYNVGGCQYILGLNRVNKKTNKAGYCNIELQKQRREFILSYENSIVILGGRLQLILSEKRFNNTEGGDEGTKLFGKFEDFLQYPDINLIDYEERKKAIFQEYKNTVLDLIENGHYVILVYPIPEVGWNVPRKIFNLVPKNVSKVDKNVLYERIKNNPITTSYEVYNKRTEESFKILDGIQHDKIFRVYPHKLFCDIVIKNRCITHNDKDIFYSDADHMSIKGSEKVIKLIMAEIKKIENNAK